MIESGTSDRQWGDEKMATFWWMYTEVKPTEIPDGLDMEFK